MTKDNDDLHIWIQLPFEDQCLYVFMSIFLRPFPPCWPLEHACFSIFTPKFRAQLVSLIHWRCRDTSFFIHVPLKSTHAISPLHTSLFHQDVSLSIRGTFIAKQPHSQHTGTPTVVKTSENKLFSSHSAVGSLCTLSASYLLKLVLAEISAFLRIQCSISKSFNEYSEAI